MTDFTQLPKKKRKNRIDLVRRVKRRTLKPHRGRRIVVSLHPGDVIGFREHGRHKEFTVSIAGAYDWAVLLEVTRCKAEKRRLKGKP